MAENKPSLALLEAVESERLLLNESFGHDSCSVHRNSGRTGKTG